PASGLGVGNRIRKLELLTALGRRDLSKQARGRIKHRSTQTKRFKNLSFSESIESFAGYAFQHKTKNNIVQIAVKHFRGWRQYSRFQQNSRDRWRNIQARIGFEVKRPPVWQTRCVCQ